MGQRRRQRAGNNVCDSVRALGGACSGGLDSFEEIAMADISGKLMADLLPNGTVRIVFVPTLGGGNEAPLTVKNLTTAEKEFVSTFGLTTVRASRILAAV